MATFLHNAADVRPILLVLDDLQSADTPSLLFLRFVATVLHSARILVLGAYRDPGMAPDSPLAATLVDLRREPTARSLMLRGLEEPDVTRFIDRTTGISPPASLVAAVYTETEGNPRSSGRS